MRTSPFLASLAWQTRRSSCCWQHVVAHSAAPERHSASSSMITSTIPTSANLLRCDSLMISGSPPLSAACGHGSVTAVWSAAGVIHGWHQQKNVAPCPVQPGVAPTCAEKVDIQHPFPLAVRVAQATASCEPPRGVLHVEAARRSVGVGGSVCTNMGCEMQSSATWLTSASGHFGFGLAHWLRPAAVHVRPYVH